jgi:hypothetical protein
MFKKSYQSVPGIYCTYRKIVVVSTAAVHPIVSMFSRLAGMAYHPIYVLQRLLMLRVHICVNNQVAKIERLG